MVRNMNEIQTVNTNKGISEFIDPNATYHLKLKGGNILANKKGREWIKEFLDPKLKKKKYSWLDVLNSGKLLVGREYQILTLPEGEYEPRLCYAGVGGTSEFSDTLNDVANESRALMPLAYNGINDRSNMRMLADSLNLQANQTIQTLQDELGRRDEFMKELQQEASTVYERISENESNFYKEKEAWIREKATLQQEIEALKRELEIEKLRFSLQREAMERENKLEKKIEKLTSLNEKKIDWATTLKDAIPTLAGIIPTLTGKPFPMPPMMADVPDYEEGEDDES